MTFRIPLPAFMDRFDAAVERRWDHLRGNPALDRIALSASELGDYGIVWMAIAAVPALSGDVRHGRSLVRLAVALAGESLIVNQGLKRLFQRSRPNEGTPADPSLRTPVTSSFPSGHTTSAVTAALLLSETLPIPTPLLWSGAAVVAGSRIHVRMHHPSDIAGGIVVGGVCGLALRRMLRV